MSAVIPKNYSPSFLSDRRDQPAASTKAMKSPQMPDMNNYMNAAMDKFGASMNKAGNAMIIELIVLTAAVIAIIFIIYILFNPLISNLFGSVLDTVNGITSITAESLGTITQTLGTVITTATAVVSQVSGVGVSTISTLSTVLTNTLENTTNVIVGDGSTGSSGGILGSFKDVLQNISYEIVGGDPDDSSKVGILTTINNSIVNINNAIVGVNNEPGVLQNISNTAKAAIESFVEFTRDIGAVFFSVLNTIRTSMETVVSGIQDGIRYLVEPFLNTSYGIPAIARTLAGVVASFNDSIQSVSTNIKSGIDSVTSAVNGLTNIFG